MKQTTETTRGSTPGNKPLIEEASGPKYAFVEFAAFIIFATNVRAPDEAADDAGKRDR